MAAPEGSGEQRASPRVAPRGGPVLRTLGLAVLVVAAFVVGVVAMSLGEDDEPGDAELAAGLEPDAEPETPDALPEEPLEPFGDDEGDVDVAEDYAGQPLVVNFWATWCAPCVEEMPDFQAVHEELEGDVAFLGVNVRDAPSNAEPFVDELGITYDLAVDEPGTWWEAAGGFAMPTTLFVGPDGEVEDAHAGVLSAEDLRDRIASSLGVAPAD